MPSSYIKAEWEGWEGIALVERSDGTLAPDAPHSDDIPAIPAAYKRWGITGFGPHQFTSEYWLNEYNKNPSMDHLVVTMELVFGEDKLVYASTSPISVTSQTTGIEYGYLGLLQEFPSIGFVAKIGGSSSSARSFSLSIPNEFVDAMKLVKAGRMLAGLAEISLQVDGGDYDERYVIMRGSMDSGVTFGDSDGEMIEVSVVDPREILSMDIPPYKVPSSWPFTGASANPFNHSIEASGARYEMLAGVGGMSGRAFPPAAGVGRTYPMVWGNWPRVPCVPLVRSPHASSSEFGSEADEIEMGAFGWDKHQDMQSWWVVAYGHGHRFMDPTSPGGNTFFTVQQFAESYKARIGKDWRDATGGDGEAPGYAVADFVRFGFYIGDSIRWSWSLHPTTSIPAGMWVKTCVLLEVADPSGTPITVLGMMSSDEPFDYSEKITIPMISALGTEVDPKVGTLWGSDSIINCVRYFTKSFTTLGEVGIDDALFAKAEARLGSLSVRGIINGSGEARQAKTIAWVEGELLKAFPMISMVFTGQGYGPVVVDRREFISGEYIVGQWGIIGRISSIQETPKQELFNDYMIRYAYDHDSNDFGGSIRRNSGNSIACKTSEEQCGRKVAPVIDTIFIHDRGVAEYCIDWLCEHRTLPSYYVEYSADVWMMFKHTVGDNIKLTDARLGFDEVVCSILKIEYTGDRVVLGLAVWERYSTLTGGAVNYPEPNFDPAPEGPEPQL